MSMRGYNSTPDYLFNTQRWNEEQVRLRTGLVNEIAAMNGDELLNTSTTDLALYYVDKYTFEVPAINGDGLEVDHSEINIDVSKDKNRYIHDRSQPFYMMGTKVTVEVPFSGNKIGFNIKPTTSNFNNPKGKVRSNIITFNIAEVNPSPEKVKEYIDRQIESINLHLSWLKKDANSHNATLNDLATQTIKIRKEKLLKDKSLVAGLGYKMKERQDARETYVAPNIQRIIQPKTPKPAATRDAYEPEPILCDNDYEHILSVLENMNSVFEKSPGVFRDIDEESLRSHFLVQLNGHYEGNATGETFNYEGKTDILINVDGKNIFIAECKFWSGEKAYLETLDQVLSYLSWRDTKAAVLIFNRQKKFSDVLKKIKESTLAHSTFKKLVKERNESSWTYLFGHKDDANREILITVQAYNIPERIKSRF